MKLKLLQLSGLSVLLLGLMLLCGRAGAQTTVTLFPTAYGTVESGGAQTPNSLADIEELTPRRGWFVFDLSAMAGGTITAANLVYSTLGTTVNSGATNNELNALNVDPTGLGGTALFSQIASGSAGTTNLFTGLWNGTHPLTLQTNGPDGGDATTAADLLTYLNTQLGNSATFAAFGLKRGSTNSYDFDVPQLTITYTGGVACSGLPNAGTAIASVATACPNQPFVLNATGLTAASGLTFQWEESLAGLNSWSAISNATTAFYSISGITAAMDYRLITTCTNGGQSATSTPVSVGIGQYLNCYCSPLTGVTLSQYPGSNFITSVDIPGTTLNNVTSSADPSGYQMFDPLITTNTGQLIPTLSYTLNVGMLYPQWDYAGAWIDYDQSGTYDASEFIQFGGQGSMSASFIVPATALPGQTGLRVRVNDWGNNYGSGDACWDDGGGETEDYIIDIATLTACSGQPTAGTVTGPATVCPNSPFTLSTSGMTYGSGITYDWQYYDILTATWVSTGETQTVYNVPGINTPTDYRLVVTCSNGGQTDISATQSVTLSPYQYCYCSPLNGTQLSQYPGSNYITSVAIPGTTLNNPTSSADPSGYEQFDPTITTNTGQLIPTLAYTLNISMLYPQWDYAGAWIDYDQSGTYDASEFIQFGGQGSMSASFIVPATALPGQTGLRVRVNDWGNNYGSGDACWDDGGGETEDYIIDIATLTACSGQPTAGTITGPASVCANVGFTLAASGMTYGVGITYDWQYYDVLTSTWVSTGETQTVYNVPGINTPTDYRFVVTCANGGQTDISATQSITLNPFINCYCSPLTGTTLSSSYTDNFITSVAIPGTTLNNPTSSADPSGYEQFDPLISTNTGQLIPTLAYTLNIGMMYPQWDYAGAWIDYDQSGTYDASEFIQFGGQGSMSASFIVPATALPGPTGLRVRVNDYGNNYGSGDACWDDGAGETEDYIIDIATLTPCAGQPTAGTITGPASVCANVGFTLAASGMTYGVGITYDWQYYDVLTSTWVSTGETQTVYNVPGINTPTDYRFVVTCANGGQQDISATQSITLNPFINCYCSPLTGTTLSSSYTDNFITSVAIPGTTLNNQTSSADPSGYEQFDPLISTNTGQLIPTLTYTLNIGMMYPQWDYAGAWIDYDQSGTYDASEFIQFGGQGSMSASFIVPATALPGQTGLRVRVNDWGSNYGSGDACWDDGAGETEDYIIDIATLTACSGQPTAGTIGGPTSVCPNTSFTLAVTGMTYGLGITYDWQYYDILTSTWVSTGETQVSATFATGINTPTDYRFVVTCANGGQQDISATQSITLNPYQYCYCSPLTGTQLSQYPGSNFITSVDIPGTTLNNPTSSSDPSGYEQFDPSIITNTGLILPNLTYTVNVGMLYPQWDYAGAWIDYDQSGTYDASEFIQFGGQGSLSASFTVPATALQGPTGLRVRVNDWGNNYGSGDACWDDGGGETEDYILTIGAPPTCIPPNTLTATNATSVSADLGWTSVSGSTQWEIEYGPNANFVMGTGTRVGPAGVTNPYPLTGLVAGTNPYSFFVREICAPGDTSVWSVRQVFYPLPPNDDCANAIDISNGSITNGYVSSATQSEPACDATPVANDVWYMFTTGSATTSAIVNANTSLSGTDLVMQVYSGTCGSLTAMTPTSSSGTGTSCVDGPAAGLETGTYTVTPNTTYYVRVYGYNTAQGTFQIQLVIPPANDNCANAISVPLNQTFTSSTSANTAGSSMDNPNPGYSCWSSSNDDDIWYTFTTPAMGTAVDVTINVSNYNFAGTTSSPGIGYGLFTACSGTNDLTSNCQFYPSTSTGMGSYTFTNIPSNATYYLALLTPGTGVSVSFDFYLTYNWLLAIKLRDVAATNVGSYNRINWVTAEEKYGDYFELEKSADGKDFTKVASQKANGEASTYTYLDQQPFSGKTYYRLKMFEASGKYEYSKVVWATMDDKKEFGVEAYPNPVGNDKLTVLAYGTDGNNATLMITDITGKVIKVVSMTNGIATIDMNGMAQGIYLVKYTDSQNSQTIKVNKQ